MNGHRSGLIWFTGLSGSGKSTLAGLLDAHLHSLGIHTYVLDGDNVRQGLNKDLGFSIEDRKENLRRVGEAAKLMVDAGLVVIAAFISPLHSERIMIRNLFDPQQFFEVYVECPLEECEHRDVKGLYSKARKGELKNFTGIDSPYDIPVQPELVLNTKHLSIDECMKILMESVSAIHHRN